MTTYLPATVVLAWYTDESLLAEAGFKGEAAATLLTIPPEYRQPCEVEASSRREYAPSYRIGELQKHRVEVAAEIRAQLAQERAG